MLSLLSILDDHLYQATKLFEDDLDILPQNGKHFETNVNVRQFKPEDVTIKATGNIVRIEGKKEEKHDQVKISKEVYRNYKFSDRYNVGEMESKLSPSGVLNIKVPSNEEKMDQESIETIIPMTIESKSN